MKTMSKEAAEKQYNIPSSVIDALIRYNRIRVKGKEMQLVVSDLDELNHLSISNFEPLRGKRITVGSAAKKYGIPKGTIWNWAHRGILASTKEGTHRYLDEAEIAYAAALRREGLIVQKKIMQELWK